MKINRNDPCPCGSGKKYKRCCINKEVKTAEPLKQLTIGSEIETLQAEAVNKNKYFKNLGVFIFFATEEGDGWLLELSQQDALLVAKAGEKVDYELTENKETIEVNWTHKFVIKAKKFRTRAYADNTVEEYPNYPTGPIFSTIKRINKNFSSELLDSIHIDG